ncbi:hypothetical protein H072_10252 [Dactylellina haptotyla CBS 200.50]|uniref:Rhamnogalacturonan endolyase n=1 Tax=Dactylellina haptotyla (strain CBS 200.50) TaxID=1284197 RepID=S8BAJ3_DACHA|nr:hypothetical protein H072_10252 [Dactylellina haptotyla CBS 200.50]
MWKPLLSLLWLAGLYQSVKATSKPKPPPGKPFLVKVNNETAIIGNDFWNVTIGRQYGTKLYYKNVDLVKQAVGHYVSYAGRLSDLNLTNAQVYKETEDFTDIIFYATEGEFHWVLTPTLTGAYQYFVNRALPVVGEFRTLWRLANDSFTYGKTSERNELLPPLSDILNATNIQDETWQRADGTFITKYDFATFMPIIQDEPDYWGVYGPLNGSTAIDAEMVGSWYIHAGVDYINGDHLKQELIVHRESQTGDSVQLNMIHGTHFQSLSDDTVPNGKTWGPWLWYLNDGSLRDVKERVKEEQQQWPYAWFQDDYGFHDRGSISGRIVLSDGQAAAHAAVFLGDNNSNKTSLDQGAWYYYRAYADRDGYFTITNVREGKWGLRAFSNGGRVLSHVSTIFKKEDVETKAGENNELGTLMWQTQNREREWQIGDIDRLATGFAFAGAPHEHGRALNCPADLAFKIGTSKDSDWCFAQWRLGAYTVEFDLGKRPAEKPAAILGVALASYSAGVSANILANGVKIGNLTSGRIPTQPALYRSATLAGEWYLYEFPIEAGLLKVGTNTVVFNVTTSTLYRGWMWDSVLLEWL